MYAMLDKARELKKECFHKSDMGHKKISLDLNLVIDIILAYEHAAIGDTENLNYSLEVAHAKNQKYYRLMNEIASRVDCDSEVWELAMAHV